ncbi:MAG: branched-chain amino acid ABC transporter permease [Armatimonadota bacterium]
MKTNFFTSTLLWAVLGLVAVAVTPLFVKSNYWLGVLAFMAINTILAVGLNLLMGYAGQVSLGHAAFYGIGAYTTAILTTQYGVSPWLAMPAGILITCIIAYLVGVPCLRLHGHYLAMATLGFGWIVYIVLVHWDTLTLGTSGVEKIPKLAIGSLVFDNDVKRFFLTWIIAILLLLISANIVRSRVGRALRALHSSENAAATMGVDVSRYKVMVFVLSAAYAALAGSLYAHVVNFISPSVFGFIVSVELVVMVVIGGMASVWGAAVGAATITMLVEWLRSLGEAVPVFKEFDVIAHGLILVLVMLFLPSGLTIGARDLVLRWFKRRRPAPVPQEKTKEVARV